MAVIEYDEQGNGTNASSKRMAETISVVQLFRMFPDEDACYAWLEEARWQGTPVCPHCGGIENIVSDKRERPIHGTWHHVSPKHLERYVNEASFRLNEGNCQVDTIDRMTEFARGVGGKRLAYRDLIAGNGESATPVAV